LNCKIAGEIIKFQPYSKYPPCLKDIAFWVPPGFHVNAFFELVGQVAGDLVERVEVIDQFVHPKTQEKSVCFRITYRSMDRSLTNEEINDLQNVVREQSAEKLKVTLR
jgi:phenylalanyl-tRNA synthetase alpha chain